ncbi:hypothetical protein ACT3SP_10925 [Brachybacterium sp. AOP43-C2-M15]|uniref:hypothetical protein n=1 Tax=Brachybacterium sp. AOP43-C2-M15 TaxID=3457661 RepID=UPI004034AF87
MRTTTRPIRIPLFIAGAAIAALLGVQPAAIADDSRFCDNKDFTYFHYSTVNPHYDQQQFLQHYDLGNRHYHSWWNATDGMNKEVDCGEAIGMNL